MTPKQKQLHDAAVQRAGMIARIQLDEGRPLSRVEFEAMMAALQRARMAACASGLVDGKTGGSPKLDAVGTILTHLRRAAQRKVVVFSQWTRLGVMVANRCKELGLGALRFYGRVPASLRPRLLRRFEDDPRCEVLISTDVGGTGLNLQCTSAVVHMEVPWNPAVLAQRTARVSRLGQTRDVRVVTLVTEESYEWALQGPLGHKQELFHSVLGGQPATEDETQAPNPGLARRALWAALERIESRRSKAA